MTNQAFLQQTLSSELERFHNVVAALPADKLDYRHDPRSRSAAELVRHVIGHFQALSTLIRPMGGKVPAIYGPSGDTEMAG